MQYLKQLAVLLVLAVSMSACSTMGGKEEASLYDRLGGKEAITAVVGHVWGLASKDDRINGYFANTSPDAFAGVMIDFLCAGSGGPCTYKGKNMHDAHVGMKITSEHFDLLADHVSATLDHFKVPGKEKNEVMTMWNGMKGTIINI